MLALSHTTVPVERLFSGPKDFKTQRMNRLTTENLEASLLIYQKFRDGDCTFTKEKLEKCDGLWEKPLPKAPVEVEIEEEKEVDNRTINNNPMPQDPQVLDSQSYLSQDQGRNPNFFNFFSSFNNPSENLQKPPFFIFFSPSSLSTQDQQRETQDIIRNLTHQFGGNLQPNPIIQEIPDQKEPEAADGSRPAQSIENTRMLIENENNNQNNNMNGEKQGANEASKVSKKSKAKEPLDQTEYNKNQNGKISNKKNQK